MDMQVQAFFDEGTATFSYVVYARDGSACAIIDPVLGYEPRAGRLNTQAADELVAYVRRQGLQVQWLLETHAHADHLTAAQYLRDRLGGRIGIGSAIVQVQHSFAELLGLGSEFARDGSQFDHLFQPGERFSIGALQAQALHVPGHTPADMAYWVDGALFVGDALFMPDVGSGRCDFPGGSANRLYHSIQRILAYPEHTRLYVGHDYPPPGRGPTCSSTVAVQRADNIHVSGGVDEAAFVALRRQRDAGLPLPTLLWPAIQVNIRAGQLPGADAQGRIFLKVPVNAL